MKSWAILAVVVLLIGGAWMFQQKRCNDYQKQLRALTQVGIQSNPAVDFGTSRQVATSILDEPWPGC